MEFKGTKGEWYKMDAKRMGVPFIIASGNETIFQAYGEDAEHNVNLTLCAREMWEMLGDISGALAMKGDSDFLIILDEIDALREKGTTI